MLDCPPTLSSTGGDPISGHPFAFSPVLPGGDGNCPLATFSFYWHVSEEMSFKLFPGLDPARPVQTASNRPPCELIKKIIFFSLLHMLCTHACFTSSHQICLPCHEPNNYNPIKRNRIFHLKLGGQYFSHFFALLRFFKRIGIFKFID